MAKNQSLRKFMLKNDMDASKIKGDEEESSGASEMEDDKLNESGNKPTAEKKGSGGRRGNDGRFC